MLARERQTHDDPAGGAVGLGERSRLTRAYDNRAHVGDWRAILARWAADSARLYETRPVYRDLRYGPHERHRLDFFPASAAGRPTLLYTHGGYWQWVDKEGEAFVAEGPLAHGFNVALCEYRLCPAASFGEVVADVHAAADWLAPRLADYGGDPERLFVGGSSAGAHLAATLLDRHYVKGALLVSGIYDLEPIVPTSVNDALGLDIAAAHRHSPILHPPRVSGPVCFAIGGDELPEMIRQTCDYQLAWTAHGLPGWCETVPEANHFSVLDQLRRPDGVLARALARLGDM
jgi:acetyl esterase/lipase